MSIIKTKSNLETINLGEKIASNFNGGDIILLKGELGSGKTTLVKGIAKFLKINPNDITSPTFTLMNVYPVTDNTNIKSMVHIDTYRLDDEKELLDIGIEDYLGKPDTICLIEWPEKINKLLENKKTIKIMIENENETDRNITIQSNE